MKNNLISKLQSRIAKRRSDINFHLWLVGIHKKVNADYSVFNKDTANSLGLQQKLDKLLLKELHRIGRVNKYLFKELVDIKTKEEKW